jgi:hypothetical protein
VWTSFLRFRIGNRGFCEHGNELSDSIKNGKFLNHVSVYYLLKKDCSMGSVDIYYVEHYNHLINCSDIVVDSLIFSV